MFLRLLRFLLSNRTAQSVSDLRGQRVLATVAPARQPESEHTAGMSVAICAAGRFEFRRPAPADQECSRPSCSA